MRKKYKILLARFMVFILLLGQVMPVNAEGVIASAAETEISVSDGDSSFVTSTEEEDPQEAPLQDVESPQVQAEVSETVYEVGDIITLSGYGIHEIQVNFKEKGVYEIPSNGVSEVYSGYSVFYVDAPEVRKIEIYNYIDDDTSIQVNAKDYKEVTLSEETEIPMIDDEFEYYLLLKTSDSGIYRYTVQGHTEDGYNRHLYVGMRAMQVDGTETKITYSSGMSNMFCMRLQDESYYLLELSESYNDADYYTVLVEESSEVKSVSLARESDHKNSVYALESVGYMKKYDLKLGVTLEDGTYHEFGCDDPLWNCYVSREDFLKKDGTAPTVDSYGYYPPGEYMYTYYIGLDGITLNVPLTIIPFDKIDKTLSTANPVIANLKGRVTNDMMWHQYMKLQITKPGIYKITVPNGSREIFTYEDGEVTSFSYAELVNFEKTGTYYLDVYSWDETYSVTLEKVNEITQMEIVFMEGRGVYYNNLNKWQNSCGDVKVKVVFQDGTTKEMERYTEDWHNALMFIELQDAKTGEAFNTDYIDAR